MRIPNMEDLKDKVVVITGASSGIGAAIALKFAEQGAKLALCGRNKDSLENVAKQCNEKGLDKSKINNAGSGKLGGIEAASLDDFDVMYTIHIRAVVSLTQKLLPFLKETEGVIINMSSLLGIRPLPFAMALSTVEAGKDHLTRCLAAELGPHKIRVVGINPGTIRTPAIVTTGIAQNHEEANKWCDEQGRAYPLGRVGFPEEVAETVVFMASQKASFVTGCNLLVDGGYAQTVGAF